jgi:hypothetical protein
MTARASPILASALLVVLAESLAGQYPLAPSPVLDTSLFPHDVRFLGYVSVRGVVRHDTLTWTVNRARVTAHVRPAPFAMLRLQVDYTATGRTTADTVPAIVLTDAYLTLVPPPQASTGRRSVRPALVLGQFRTPFSLEFLTPFSLLQTATRSQPEERITTRRDIGVLGQVAVGQRATLLAAVVNGEGPNRIANADGHELVIGRVTLFPHHGLAVSAKYEGQGADHRWGFDGRWIGHGVIAEGEFLARRGSISATTTTDASGGYLLASYKARPWLQPVLKWERLRDARATGATTTLARLTYTTVGVNFVTRGETLRFQVNGIFKSEQPVATGNEVVAQLIAIF